MDTIKYISCCHKRNTKSNSDASSRLLKNVRIFAQYYILIGSSVRPVNCRPCVRVADESEGAVPRCPNDCYGKNAVINDTQRKCYKNEISNAKQILKFLNKHR
jgi:hypothetical protein